jgi:hypothetical protein
MKACLTPGAWASGHLVVAGRRLLSPTRLACTVCAGLVMGDNLHVGDMKPRLIGDIRSTETPPPAV